MRLDFTFAVVQGVAAVQHVQKAAQDLMQAAAASIDARKLLAAAVAAYVIVLPCCQGKPAAAFDQSPAVLSRGATVFGNNCGERRTPPLFPLAPPSIRAHVQTNRHIPSHQYRHRHHHH